MAEKHILLPSKPKVVFEEGNTARFQIDGLYPGYGHTLGNSLRRIILSSLTGAAITSVKIKGVEHEFSALDGVEEDIITILLNLKKIRMNLEGDEPQKLSLKISGEKEVTAKDIDAPSQVSIANPEQIIAHVTDKKGIIEMEILVEKGIGFVSKEVLQKDKVDIGTIALDANFSPIRRVNYEVENMRVGDRTDFNRLYIYIETDGSVTPVESLEHSIAIMIDQLKAIVGFEEEEEEVEEIKEEKTETAEDTSEILKTRIDSIDNLSSRTMNALTAANIRTLGGLARKKESDILDIEGLGEKGLKEIEKVLKKNNLELKA